MGKRIERIFSEKLLDKLPALEGMPITLILKNGNTIKGKLAEYNDAELKISFKFKNFQLIQYSKIQELQIDSEAAW